MSALQYTVLTYQRPSQPHWAFTVSYYSFPVPLTVGGWVGLSTQLAVNFLKAACKWPAVRFEPQPNSYEPDTLHTVWLPDEGVSSGFVQKPTIFDCVTIAVNKLISQLTYSSNSVLFVRMQRDPDFGRISSFVRKTRWDSRWHFYILIVIM